MFRVKPNVEAVTATATKSANLFAYIFGVITFCYFWYLGAISTLIGLELGGINIKSIGIAAWLIPLGISFVERLWIFKTGGGFSGAKIVLSLMFVVADIGTSFYAVERWLAERELPFFIGFTLHSGTPILFAAAVIISTFITFFPEYFIIKLANSLKEEWNV